VFAAVPVRWVPCSAGGCQWGVLAPKGSAGAGSLVGLCGETPVALSESPEAMFSHNTAVCWGDKTQHLAAALLLPASIWEVQSLSILFCGCRQGLRSHVPDSR